MNVLSRLFCPAAFFLLGAAHPAPDSVHLPSPVTYYSTSVGDFQDPDFWNTAADGSGTSATYPTPDDDDVFIIQSNQTVTINTGDLSLLGTLDFGTGSGGEGTLALNGLFAQTVSGSVTVVLNNLNINMGFIGDISLQKSITGHNVLTLTLGFLHLADN